MDYTASLLYRYFEACMFAHGSIGRDKDDQPVTMLTGRPSSCKLRNNLKNQLFSYQDEHKPGYEWEVLETKETTRVPGKT